VEIWRKLANLSNTVAAADQKIIVGGVQLAKRPHNVSDVRTDAKVLNRTDVEPHAHGDSVARVKIEC
jgi:hypothetical protein